MKIHISAVRCEWAEGVLSRDNYEKHHEEEWPTNNNTGIVGLGISPRGETFSISTMMLSSRKVFVTDLVWPVIDQTK